MLYERLIRSYGNPSLNYYCFLFLLVVVVISIHSSYLRNLHIAYWVHILKFLTGLYLRFLEMTFLLCYDWNFKFIVSRKYLTQQVY